MKVSIVIPAHNEEVNIEKTLDAIFKQTYHNFEVLVVDNASTDKTNSILHAYKNKHHGLKLKILSENRKGTQWARECGRLDAEGGIIANIDADCIPHANWLEKGMHSFLVKEVVAVGGPYDYYDAPKMTRWFSLYFQKIFYFIVNIVLQKLHKGGVLIGGNVLLRADALEKAGGYNTDLVFYGDDTDTAKRMSRQGRVVFNRNLSMPTSARRLKSQGVIRTSLIYFYHFFRIIFKKSN
ncbi:MAG: glycosyltransferase family 2 protein [bacterium]